KASADTGFQRLGTYVHKSLLFLGASQNALWESSSCGMRVQFQLLILEARDALIGDGGPVTNM
ncbi:MAG: hypothetical protein OXI08_09710, partial [Cyanobacteria bacterium MAG IRC4_bin_6]|nr:hypothetical protein [Cyanobacteria bacterium MAG IRC3_bin_20]MDE0648287.1 hypothetical protein [Cyanobacteria bacterium MAG IRC4_bin_6]